MPPYSPVQDLSDVFDLKSLDLSGWKAGFCRLKDLLMKGQIPLSDYFRSKICHYNVLQYYQVKSPVTSLEK